MRTTTKGVSGRGGEAHGLARRPGRTRPLRIVILDDQPCLHDVYRFGLERWYNQIEVVRCHGGDAAWEELSREEPDLFITDRNHPGMSCSEMLKRLAERKAKFPIILISAGVQFLGKAALRSAEKNLNFTFLHKPFEVDRFREVVEAALGVPARVTTRKSLVRIVLVDDVDTTLEGIKGSMQFLLPEAQIQAFSTYREGLEVLEREEPDLFTMDWTNGCGISGPEMLQRLATMQVRCPIFVISAVAKDCGAEKLLKDYGSEGLKLELLEKPFTLQKLGNLLRRHLSS